jgi:gamma-glutamyltranspeptidase
MLWSLKGSLPWAALVTPAATLAYSWTIDNEVALLLLEIKTQLRSGLYPLLSALYIKPDGTLKIAGDTVQQPVLASTLLKIAKLGPDYLYVTMASTIAKGEKTIESRKKCIEKEY